MNTNLGLIGKKLGNTQIFNDDGSVTPVTVVEAGPCVVVGKRTPEKDGYSALQLGFFGGELAAKDTRLWTLGTGIVATLLVLAGAGVHLRAVLRRYELIASFVGSLVLMKLALFPQILADSSAARIESYFCMLSVFIVGVALRFRLVITAATLLGTGTLALLFIVLFAPHPDLRAFTYYFGSSTLVALFVAWQLEEKEKVAFLQQVVIDHDARTLESMNHELLRLARHDALSGLANRRELERRLGIEWERLRRDGKPLAVVFADIDWFKAYNDAYGHAAGDECLVRVASTLRACLLRPADFAARYGGEEFVLVLPDTDLAGALDVARRALAAVDALAIPHVGSKSAPHVTLSLGVASVVPDDAPTADRLLDRADRALYAAKRAGRHDVSVAGGESERPGARESVPPARPSFRPHSGAD